LIVSLSFAPLSALTFLTASVSLGVTKKPLSSLVGYTGRPGRNFNDAGLGVSAVWMKIVRIEEVLRRGRVKRERGRDLVSNKDILKDYYCSKWYEKVIVASIG